MKKILESLEQELKVGLQPAAMKKKFAKVVLSNRPDLCEYQCNGAMAAAKAYKKKPIDIANAVVEQLTEKMQTGCISEVEAVRDAWFYQFKTFLKAF